MRALTRLRRRLEGLCQYCGVNPPMPYYNGCYGCHNAKRDRQAQLKFDRRLDREELLREQGLIPANELMEIMGITRPSLQHRVRTGTLVPVVKNHYGQGYNWYREVDAHARN